MARVFKGSHSFTFHYWSLPCRSVTWQILHYMAIGITHFFCPSCIYLRVEWIIPAFAFPAISHGEWKSIQCSLCQITFTVDHLFKNNVICFISLTEWHWRCLSEGRLQDQPALWDNYSWHGADVSGGHERQVHWPRLGLQGTVRQGIGYFARWRLLYRLFCSSCAVSAPVAMTYWLTSALSLSVYLLGHRPLVSTQLCLVLCLHLLPANPEARATRNSCSES